MRRCISRTPRKACSALVRRRAGRHALHGHGLADRCRRTPEQLVSLRDRYGDLDLYVTENGACFDDPLAADGTVHDDDRIDYLREHLGAARRALAAGVKLRGYFVWSLLDNFEWAEGYQPALRRGPCRFLDAQAHAEGIISMADGIHQGAIPPLISPLVPANVAVCNSRRGSHLGSERIATTGWCYLVASPSSTMMVSTSPAPARRNAAALLYSSEVKQATPCSKVGNSITTKR